MILLVAHTKGGVGKSTLTINLAVELQRRGADVILVEADPTVHTVSNWARDREENGHPPIQAVQKTGNLRSSLLDLAARYDYVIVDVPGKDSKEMRTAMTAANVLLMPVVPYQAELDTTESVVATLTEAKDFNPEVKALAVLNMAPTNTGANDVRDAREYLSDYPEVAVARTVVHQRKAFRNALSQGLGVVEMRDPKAKAEIQLLIQEIATWH
ncbi:AAA family ATPase [uncultured Arthrobacter sp.]|uniref:AAA family ATPase n=1 Tax=uncultured Arthrobacter sp. TaxID=114050 RepID=UPI0026351A00|nr:AAA family ATPase [uncultured Arthrobacter sp.]